MDKNENEINKEMDKDLDNNKDMKIKRYIKAEKKTLDVNEIEQLLNKYMDAEIRIENIFKLK